MVKSRSFYVEALWFVLEFVTLLGAFLVVFAGASRFAGVRLGEDFPTMVFMTLYFCTAMRLKGVAL